MPFVKGDKNINREGRPKNAEKDLLREALENEGKRRGKPFWTAVAKKAYSDKNVMIAVLKKFVPDTNITELSGEVKFTQMPAVKVNGKDLEVNIE